jgi:DNA-binding HxlR family transcriptional regulator
VNSINMMKEDIPSIPTVNYALRSKADIEEYTYVRNERRSAGQSRLASRRPKAVSAEALLDVEKARPVLEQIANKWSVLILTVLCTRPSRFNEIMRRLDGITHKALADALKRLERNGLIRRDVLTTTTPVGVEYTITSLGRSRTARRSTRGP